MITDLTEHALERLICNVLIGDPSDPLHDHTVSEPLSRYGGVGWSSDNRHDYNRAAERKNPNTH